MKETVKACWVFVVLAVLEGLIIMACHGLQAWHTSLGSVQFTHFTFPIHFSLEVLPWLLSGCVFGVALRKKVTLSGAFCAAFLFLTLLLYVFFLCNYWFWQPILLPEILPEVIMAMAFGAGFMACSCLP